MASEFDLFLMHIDIMENAFVVESVCNALTNLVLLVEVNDENDF